MLVTEAELATLLSVSSEFERALQTRRTSLGTPAMAALQLMGELEAVARASLMVRSAAQPTRTPPPLPVSRSNAPRPLPPVAPKAQAVSAHREYRPALGNPEIVEALLAYHRKPEPDPAPRRPALPQEPIVEPPHEESDFSAAALERLSARELAPRFPFDPRSKLLTTRTKS